MSIAPSRTLRLLKNTGRTASSVLQGLLGCGPLVVVEGRGTSEGDIFQPGLKDIPNDNCGWS